jgi:hypothetical protein
VFGLSVFIYYIIVLLFSNIATNVPSAEAVPDKYREKAKHLFADFR